MTSEQIAELRRLHDGVIAQDTQWARRHGQAIYPENVDFLVACNNSLRQLLDEREALLETGKKVLEELFGPSTHPTVAALRAAIAKAEAS